MDIHHINIFKHVVNYQFTRKHNTEQVEIKRHWPLLRKSTLQNLKKVRKILFKEITKSKYTYFNQFYSKTNVYYYKINVSKFERLARHFIELFMLLLMCWNTVWNYRIFLSLRFLREISSNEFCTLHNSESNSSGSKIHNNWFHKRISKRQKNSSISTLCNIWNKIYEKIKVSKSSNCHFSWHCFKILKPCF